MSFFPLQGFFVKYLQELAIIFHTICNLFVTLLSHSHFFFSALYSSVSRSVMLMYLWKTILHFLCVSLIIYFVCTPIPFVFAVCVCVFFRSLSHWSERICHEIQSFRIINTRIIRMFWAIYKMALNWSGMTIECYE